MTENEIKRELTFEEELSYYRKRLKEVFDNYENPTGSEDRLEICVLRQSNRVLNKAETEIERLRNILLCFMNEVEKWENKYALDISELPLIPIRGESAKIKEQIEAEAIKEFAERLKSCAHEISCNVLLVVTKDDIDNLVKEMVGEG